MLDPYQSWLAIPPGTRPPTFYQLLDIHPDEKNAEVIKEAALRRTARLRVFQMGPQIELCTRLLNEVAQARATLLNPQARQAYDQSLLQASAPALPSVPFEAPTASIQAPPEFQSWPDPDLTSPVRGSKRQGPSLPVLDWNLSLSLVAYVCLLGLVGGTSFLLATRYYDRALSPSPGREKSNTTFQPTTGERSP